MSSGQEVGEIFGDGSGPATALLRSPTVIIAAVGLWGMNVYLFRLFGIDYAHVLTLDLIKEKEANEKGEGKQDDASTSGDTCSIGSSNSAAGLNLEKRHGHSSNSSTTPDHSPGSASKKHYGNNEKAAAEGDQVTAGKLITFSLSLLLLLHLSTVIWIDYIGGSAIGAIFAFYTSVVVGIVVPFPSSAWIRTACVTVFHRAFELINPRCFCLQSGIPRAVPFIDVFFADAMCSLSKVFFDWGMLWHVSWLFVFNLCIFCGA